MPYIFHCLDLQSSITSTSLKLNKEIRNKRQKTNIAKISTGPHGQLLTFKFHLGMTTEIESIYKM